MKKKKIIIYKDVLKRKNFLKKEIYFKIYKSILQNLQINQYIRIEMSRKLCMLWRKCNLSKQNNICLKTGRVGGVFSTWSLSRQSIKEAAKWNLLTNVKIKSK